MYLTKAAFVCYSKFLDPGADKKKFMISAIGWLSEDLKSLERKKNQVSKEISVLTFENEKSKFRGL